MLILFRFLLFLTLLVLTQIHASRHILKYTKTRSPLPFRRLLKTTTKKKQQRLATTEDIGGKLDLLPTILQ
jgi:hypothetical protein